MVGYGTETPTGPRLASRGDYHRTSVYLFFMKVTQLMYLPQSVKFPFYIGCDGGFTFQPNLELECSEIYMIWWNIVLTPPYSERNYSYRPNWS